MKFFLKLIKDVKDKCLPKKVVKYNKKKHKRCKRMTSALLKSLTLKIDFIRDEKKNLSHIVTLFDAA